MSDPPLREKTSIYTETEGPRQNTKMPGPVPVSTKPPRATRPTKYRAVQDVHKREVKLLARHAGVELINATVYVSVREKLLRFKAAAVETAVVEN